MILREEFLSSGTWIFRWRSYLPFFLVGVILFALRDYDYPGGSEVAAGWWDIFCVATSFLGLLIRIITVGHTPSGTSGRNTRKQIADSLNTTGIYSVVRNPLYLGNFFVALGMAMFACLWWVVVIYTLVFWVYYERIIFVEEDFLIKKFDHEYLAWANAARAFMPKLALYKASALPFSMRYVLRREGNTLLTLVGVFFLLEITRNYYLTERFQTDTNWLLLLSGSTFIWAVLRFLRKRTTLLDVLGR